MRFSVCTDAVLRHQPTTEAAMAIAKQAGFDLVEFWAWWEKDLDAISAAAANLEQRVCAMCTPFWPLTERACHSQYLVSLVETANAAEKLGCRIIITQSGRNIEKVERKLQRRNMVECLRRAGEFLGDRGMTLVLEPVNATEYPETFLSSAAEAFSIIDEVGDPSVKVLYDLYHQQVSGDLDVAAIEKNIGKIGHFHLAGYPGRGSIQNTQTDYARIIRAADRSDYSGALGLEYFTAQDDAAMLTAARDSLRACQ